MQDIDPQLANEQVALDTPPGGQIDFKSFKELQEALAQNLLVISTYDVMMNELIAFLKDEKSAQARTGKGQSRKAVEIIAAHISALEAVLRDNKFVKLVITVKDISDMHKREGFVILGDAVQSVAKPVEAVKPQQPEEKQQADKDKPENSGD